MISPLAYVDKEARIGANVTIHPFAYIDKNVEIGDNCTIMPYASILSGTRMGTDNIIYQGAIIGATPQDFKFKGEDTLLKIGNHNTIREKVILNRGTNTTHLGSHCVLGNGAKTAGNCIIDDKAILGSEVIVKHGCRIGSWALLRDGCRANKDVPPYIVAAHNPISYYGINALILAKEGHLTENVIDNIAKCYRQIYQCGTSLENALRRIKDIIPLSPEITYLVDFIEQSKKGIIGTTM